MGNSNPCRRERPLSALSNKKLMSIVLEYQEANAGLAALCSKMDVALKNIQLTAAPMIRDIKGKLLFGKRYLAVLERIDMLTRKPTQPPEPETPIEP